MTVPGLRLAIDIAADAPAWAPELNLATGLLLKPLVFVAAVVALARLWPQRRTPHGALFVAGFASFAAGELVCASDVYLRARMTPAGEIAHDLLMAVAGALFIAGVYVYARASYRCWNRECRRYPACTRLAFECRRSDRYGVMPVWLLVTAALLALLPVFAPAGLGTVPLPAGLRGMHLGTYLYDRGPAISFVEQRVLPVFALAALAAAALRYGVRRRMDAPALWFAALGAGTLGFVDFRVTLVHLFFPDATLAGFWEESIELLSVALFLAWWRGADPGARRPASLARTRANPAHAAPVRG